ncbi:prolipoprotein diacylglyceryl transferase [Olsenella urininfantis]|uniref:prolipoprotein diacylglyceryl transferase n=1 Tax=Olsenella urininfantis TaxID=1871033 RepID=UPI00098692EB|nr:prolipoprotein diacylglyceryl transferase [Olsenella urininfantis]
MWLDAIYHALDPIAFSLGPFAVRWYGLAYFAGFMCAGTAIYRVSRRWGLGLEMDDVINVMVAVALGVILGGRLGYVLFYGGGYFLANPLKVLAINEGGMSFHGGLVGALVAGGIACRVLGLSLPTICDLAAIGAPLGLFFGRCANFVNGELWGKQADVPWAVMFSETGGGMVYRHPSQLYEALLEGLLLFVILFALSRRRPAWPQGTFLGSFLALYGCFRFLIEFVRLPDPQLGYLLGTTWLTMGQCLSLPLVLAGLGLLSWARVMRRDQRAFA